MTALLKPALCLPIAVLSVTVALAEAVAANNELPIKGRIQAVETSFALFPPLVTAPTLVVEANGWGRATHLGRFTVTYNVEVNLETFFGVGSQHFIAANGDSLFTTVVGQGTVPTADGFSFVVETHTITGGTGRFEGATGSFTLERVLNVFTGATSGSFEGTINKQ